MFARSFLRRRILIPLFSLTAGLGLFLGGVCSASAQENPPRKKIVLIAGPKSHGPVGNGIHDYGWSVCLLRVMLEHSNIKDRVRVEHHLDGWPRDPKTLDDADTIMVVSDGRDGDRYAEAPHLASPERVRYLDGLMRRGCGFLTFHFSTFTPDQYAEQVLRWSGGYFDWETDGKRQWYSAIKTLEAEVRLGTPDHPVARGLTAFRLREEFYYNLRFPPKDASLRPIWVVPALGGREPDGDVVAWAREREGGGRGFGTTCGHFYDNWKHAPFRKLILNALAWTAKVEVPKDGVEARFFTHEEIRRYLGANQVPATPGGKPTAAEKPIRVLLLAGNQAHQWHNWEKTTPAIRAALERDPRIRVEVSTDIEDLARKKLADYQVLVQNYCNWHDPKGLSELARRALVQYLENGGGLILVHFANGAFHFSLPRAGASDWPEYRKIVRRVWDHDGKTGPKSGHDAFGKFTVHVTKVKHPITDGLKDFEVTDELYYHQAGSEPVEPLLTARSKVTQKEEPLAFAYTYGKGRVFQTLLGHSEKTYDAFEAREVLRRAAAWAAGREARPLNPANDHAPGSKPPRDPLTEGRFGKALDARVAPVTVAGKPEYRRPPLTVECWVKLLNPGGYSILVASDAKASAAHWEIFTLNGVLTTYLPGMTPDHVRSSANLGDGRWHHVAMTYTPGRVRLFVDGKPVADQAITPKGGAAKPGDLAIGTLVERGLGCNGLLDELRLSQGIREITAVPDAPFAVDRQTVGLWRFDRMERGEFEDASPLKNPARSAAVVTPKGQGPTPSAGPHCEPADPKLKAVLIDRSPGDAYMAVKVDTTGRVFVGGREAVFVFEPDAGGGYARRRLLPFPADSIIIGLELRGDDLYVLTDNALYVVPGGRVRREGLTARRLLWGLPLDLHVSFHCLAWGPEGDLYLNHGDPLLNFSDFNRPDHWGHWTLYHQREVRGMTRTWASTPYTGVGAVLRLRPDGTSPRVVSTGYRGPVGLAFDRHWNLFTNDNDHESRADLYAPARLMHVTPHSDFAWPRGWMASKSPERADLLEPMIATLGRGVPCGLAYYDEPLLGKDHGHSLLMGRWDRLATTRYPLERRGASFATCELPFLVGRDLARPVGVAVGRGGRVFVTLHYLAGNVSSPHCVSDLVVVTTKDDLATHPFEPYDLPNVPAERLWKDLSSPSWERRSSAHQEILRRGGPLLDEAVRRLAQAKDDDPAWNHLSWLAGATGSADAARLLADLSGHPKAEFRLQAIRILAEFPKLKAPPELFSRALADTDPQVQMAALAALFQPSAPLPLPAVVKLATRDDTYLRHTASRLLARRASLKEIAALVKAGDPKTRLAGVLAAGVRLTVPPSDYTPPESLKLAYSHGNAAFTLRYADADQPMDLRAHGRVGSYTTAQWWAVVPRTPEQNELFDLLLAALKDPHAATRLQAAYWLSLLRDPRSESLVAAVQRDARLQPLLNLPVRDIARVWTVGPFDDGDRRFGQVHPPEQGVIDLTATYPAEGSKRQWQETVGRMGRFSWDGPQRSSHYLHFRLQSVTPQPALLALDSAGPAKVWLNGRLIGREDESRPGEPRTVPLDLQPGSNDVLIRVHHPAGVQPVEVRYRARTDVFATLPEKLDSALLAQRLKEAGASSGTEKVGPEFLTVDWVRDASQGDPAQGRKLFGNLACAKCHAILPDQKGGGAPNLADVRKRFTVPHLVESILLPSKQVAEPFWTTIVALKNGQVVSGLLVNETANELEVLQPDATRKVVRKDEAEERQMSPLSPMPAGLVKTPQELRDLLAYLLSEKPLPP